MLLSKRTQSFTTNEHNMTQNETTHQKSGGEGAVIHFSSFLWHLCLTVVTRVSGGDDGNVSGFFGYFQNQNPSMCVNTRIWAPVCCQYTLETIPTTAACVGVKGVWWCLMMSPWPWRSVFIGFIQNIINSGQWMFQVCLHQTQCNSSGLGQCLDQRFPNFVWVHLWLTTKTSLKPSAAPVFLILLDQHGGWTRVTGGGLHSPAVALRCADVAPGSR